MPAVSAAGAVSASVPGDAVCPASDESNDILNKKMMEYSKAVLQGRPHFHISLVVDVSPFCDCHGENDAAIVPDVGMFASFDPVALDVACADAVNRQPILGGAYWRNAIIRDMIILGLSALIPTGRWGFATL